MGRAFGHRPGKKGGGLYAVRFVTLTGHQTRAVFDRYDIVNEADLRGAVEKLAARHARPETGARAAIIPLKKAARRRSR